MRLKLSTWALFGSALALSVPVISVASRPAAAGHQSPPYPAPKASHRQIVLRIERSPNFGVILVSLRVNGKPALLILDTGSSTTVLSPEISGLNPARLQHADPPRKGTGFLGDGRWGQATLTIGTTVWKDKRVLIVDTKDLSHAFQRKIDGILGQDILDEFKYVEIDLKDKRLTLGSDWRQWPPPAPRSPSAVSLAAFRHSHCTLYPFVFLLLRIPIRNRLFSHVAIVLHSYLT